MANDGELGAPSLEFCASSTGGIPVAQNSNESRVVVVPPPRTVFCSFVLFKSRNSIVLRRVELLPFAHVSRAATNLREACESAEATALSRSTCSSLRSFSFSLGSPSSRRFCEELKSCAPLRLPIRERAASSAPPSRPTTSEGRAALLVCAAVRACAFRLGPANARPGGRRKTFEFPLFDCENNANLIAIAIAAIVVAAAQIAVFKLFSAAPPATQLHRRSLMSTHDKCEN